MLSNNWLNYQIMTDLLREETDCNDLTYKDYGTSRIINNNKSRIKQSDFLSRGDFLMGETISFGTGLRHIHPVRRPIIS